LRVGIGYDIHRLVEGRPMVLGGVEIPFGKGPEGHSDGDALLHAVCDAILGALAKDDIGTRFPDTEAEYKDISSSELLRRVAGLAREEGYAVQNLDCVVVAEEPKIAPHRARITEKISGILGCPRGAVSVKGKTSEGLGPVGEGKAIAASAVVLLKEKG
jgi:2-C-methyl-D-erythritol 2,4-cyclodiphosphate synthase